MPTEPITVLPMTARERCISLLLPWLVMLIGTVSTMALFHALCPVPLSNVVSVFWAFSVLVWFAVGRYAYERYIRYLLSRRIR